MLKNLILASLEKNLNIDDYAKLLNKSNYVVGAKLLGITKFTQKEAMLIVNDLFKKEFSFDFLFKEGL